MPSEKQLRAEARKRFVDDIHILIDQDYGEAQRAAQRLTELFHNVQGPMRMVVAELAHYRTVGVPE